MYSTAVYQANTGRVQHTVVVAHEPCGQLHLHRTRSLAPFVRRALCGLDRYRIVPVLADVEYGSDHPDADDWADRDGRVYRGDEGPKLRRAS